VSYLRTKVYYLLPQPSLAFHIFLVSPFDPKLAQLNCKLDLD